MSEAGIVMNSPFLLKRMSNRLDVIEVNVSAQAIKKRKIHLLEWALLAPLSELDDPKPTLEEIGTEFGIDKIEFLEHVAKNLTTLGVLSQDYDNIFDITEMGQKLYRKGEMVSDPRIFNVPIYYEPQSKEWFVGVKNIEAREFVNRFEDSVFDIDQIPLHVPEKLINEHIKSLKLIDKGESVETPTIQELKTKITDVELKVFLQNGGLDLDIIKNPFGEQYNALLKRIFKEQLIVNGGFKQHLKDYEEAASEFTDIPIKQCHSLGDASIYSLTDKNALVNEILTSQPKWLINSNVSAVDNIRKNKIKPEIVVHLTDNSGFDIQINDHESLIIPTSIELFAPRTKSHINSGSIVSNKGIAAVSRVEASGYKIPLYLLEQTEDTTIFENEIYSLFLQAEKNTNEKISVAIGKFILRPDETNFNTILSSIQTRPIKDGKSSKNALKEIARVRNRFVSSNTQMISNAPVYKIILDNLNLPELVDLDMNTIFHCRGLYLEQLKKSAEINSVIKDGTWNSISDAMLDNTDAYHHIKKLENRLSAEKNSVSRELLEQITVILGRFEQNADEYMSKLPKPSTKIEVEGVYAAIDDFNPSIKQKYLRIINEGLEGQISNLESNELFEIYKFLYKHGYQPKEVTLSNLAKKRFEIVNWNLLDPKFSKEIASIKNDFKTFDNIFNIDSLIDEQFPSDVEKASDKDQIQILFNNLVSLRKTGIVKLSDIKKILYQEFDLLRSSINLENIQIGLFLLANMNRVFAKDKLVDMSSDDIWEYVYPYLSSDKNARKKMDGDLKFLGLKEQLQKFDNDVKSGISNSSGENKENKNQEIQLVLDIPPIKKIIIDGSNVARQDYKNGDGSIKQLLQAYDDLINKYGFDEVRIIVGAGLRHTVPDFEELQPYIDKKIAAQAPAGVSDDEFIITIAREKNFLILTNDLYREFRNIDPICEKEIQRRRTAYMIDPDTGSFTLQFPNYGEGN
jgi:hypothetical protein